MPPPAMKPQLVLPVQAEGLRMLASHLRLMLPKPPAGSRCSTTLQPRWRFQNWHPQMMNRQSLEQHCLPTLPHSVTPAKHCAVQLADGLAGRSQ